MRRPDLSGEPMQKEIRLAMIAAEPLVEPKAPPTSSFGQWPTKTKPAVWRQWRQWRLVRLETAWMIWKDLKSSLASSSLCLAMPNSAIHSLHREEMKSLGTWLYSEKPPGPPMKTPMLDLQGEFRGRQGKSKQMCKKTNLGSGFSKQVLGNCHNTTFPQSCKF